MFTQGKNDSYPFMGNIKKSISGNLTLSYMRAMTRYLVALDIVA
jgi:hypothetical protein